MESEPSWAKKLSVELGPSRRVISFKARNPITEYTAICSFVLEVRGKDYISGDPAEDPGHPFSTFQLQFCFKIPSFTNDNIICIW